MIRRDTGSFECSSGRTPQGELFHDFTDSLFGTGVFNADGDLWK